MTQEVERVITEVHAVGHSVEAVHREARETRQELQVLIEDVKKITQPDPSASSTDQIKDAQEAPQPATGTSSADRIATLTMQQTVIANEKRLLVAAEKESRRQAAAAKAAARKQRLEDQRDERKRASDARAEARKRRLEEQAERREALTPIIEPPRGAKRKRPNEWYLAEETSEQRSWPATKHKVESDRKFALFELAMNRGPDNGMTWAEQFAKDAATEEGMNPIDRLNREDTRRQKMTCHVSGNVCAAMGSPGTRDPCKPREAILEIDARREKLMALLVPEDREAYEALRKARPFSGVPTGDDDGDDRPSSSAAPSAPPVVLSEAEAMAKATTPPYDTAAFEKIMNTRNKLGSFPSWRAKYAQDAADEASMSLFHRLINEQWRRTKLGSRQIALSRESGRNPRRGLSSTELAERTMLVDAMREANSRMVDLQAKMTMREIHAVDDWDKARVTQTRL